MDVFSVLTECGAKNFVQTFKENDIDLVVLKYLTKEELINLGLTIGQATKVQRKMEQITVLEIQLPIKKEPKVEPESEDEFISTDEPKATPVVTSESSTQLELGTDYPIEQTYIFELRKLLLPLENLNLKVLLEQKAMGKCIIADYLKNGYLSNVSRGDLCHIIINSYLDISKILRNAEILLLSQKIVELFPNECVETYYVGPTTVFEDGVKKSIVAKGKLIDKSRNNVRRLRELGIDMPTTKKKKNIQESPEGTIDKEVEGSRNWLRTNSGPLNEVLMHWKKTYVLRKNFSRTKAHSIFEEWPILNTVDGYLLIESDFDEKFPEKGLKLYLDWSTFFETILVNFPPQGDKVKNYKDIITDEASSDEERDLAMLLYLPHIVPIKGRVKGKVKWRPTLEEISDGFITVVNAPEDIDKTIRDRIDLHNSKKLPLQPFIIVIAPNLQPLDSYIITDSYRYRFDNIRRAVDICFKLFHAFNISYPLVCESVWLLLQISLYKITTEYDSVIPTVMTIVNRLSRNTQ